MKDAIGEYVIHGKTVQSIQRTRYEGSAALLGYELPRVVHRTVCLRL